MTSIPETIDEMRFSNGLEIEWNHIENTMSVFLVDGDNRTHIATLDTDGQERLAEAIEHNFRVRDALGNWDEMRRVLRSLPT